MASSTNFVNAITAAVLFLLLQVLNPAAAQDNCPSRTSCTDCLDASCSWWTAAESCIELCDLISETSCWTSQEDETTTATCERAANIDSDLTTCVALTDCSSCLGQVLADGTSTCQWYPSVDGSATFCTHKCGADGCGATECPTCDQNMSCDSCLSSACAWAPAAGGCMDSCGMVADAACFDVDTDISAAAATGRQSSTVGDICSVADSQQADAAQCAGLTGCTECVGSVLSDGTSTCQWFADAGSCASACGMDGCGETTCPTDDVPAEADSPTQAPVSGATATSFAIGVTGVLVGASAALLSGF